MRGACIISSRQKNLRLSVCKYLKRWRFFWRASLDKRLKETWYSKMYDRVPFRGS